MRQHGGQIDHPSRRVEGRGLHSCDLMLAQRLAHDIEAACEGCIAEGALWPLASSAGPDRGGQRLLGIDELGLSFCKRRGQRRH